MDNLHFLLCLILQCILRNALECCIYIVVFLGRCLKVGDIPFSCTPCFGLLLRNLSNEHTHQYRPEKNSKHLCVTHFLPIAILHLQNSHVGTNNLQVRRMKHTTRLLPPSTSTLLPRTTNGKFSGSDGLACTINTTVRRPPSDPKFCLKHMIVKE